MNLFWVSGNWEVFILYRRFVSFILFDTSSELFYSLQDKHSNLYTLNNVGIIHIIKYNYDIISTLENKSITQF